MNLVIRQSIFYFVFCSINNDEGFWFSARFHYSIYGIPKIWALT